LSKTSNTYRRQKWRLAIRLLGGGMGLALLWALWARFVLGKGYPESFILGSPAGRYGDFTSAVIAATLPNPYADPTSIFSPAAFVLFRIFSRSESISLIAIYFFSLTSLALLLTRLLHPIFRNPWQQVFLAFLYLALSYPILFCLDRGNIEIILAPLMGWALYFYGKHCDMAGCACLFPAICLKFYPALLLIVLLRRRKAGLAILCGAGAVGLTVACSFLFEAPALEIWNSYRQNLDFFRDFYVLNNSALEGSASLWNTYKIVLILLQNGGMIHPINFGLDGAFIKASYHIYSAIFGLIMLGCVLYAWMYERHQERGFLMLLLFLSIAVPNSADYRLIYASMALALLALLRRRRGGDWAALVLVALAVIPKKEILLTSIGKTETTYADVSIQSLLNPVLILTAMAILLYHSRRPFDWSQTARRLHDLLPSRWRWI
jgi:hypothetical protein